MFVVLRGSEQRAFDGEKEFSHIVRKMEPELFLTRAEAAAYIGSRVGEEIRYSHGMIYYTESVYADTWTNQGGEYYMIVEAGEYLATKLRK